jgi:hypothetical protein
MMARRGDNVLRYRNTSLYKNDHPCRVTIVRAGVTQGSPLARVVGTSGASAPIALATQGAVALRVSDFVQTEQRINPS